MADQSLIFPSLKEGEVLYITSEKVIVNLLKADREKYLPIPRLYRFVAFLWEQLQSGEYSSKGAQIIFDVNFDSIERTVQYNNMIYDLVGNKIFLKGVLPDLKDDKDIVYHLAQRFVQNFAA